MQMPAQVRRAVILLWFLLLAAVVAMPLTFNDFAAEMAAATSMPGIANLMWPIFLGVFILNALLIVFVSRGQNWARIVLLIMTIGGLATFLWPETYETPLSWDWWVSNIAFAVLDVLALYWLFTGTGAEWFSKRNERALAAEQDR